MSGRTRATAREHPVPIAMPVTVPAAETVTETVTVSKTATGSRHVKTIASSRSNS